MPEGPGADLLDVLERLNDTSSSVMGVKVRGGRGPGSSGWEGRTGFGTVGKNCSKRT